MQQPLLAPQHDTSALRGSQGLYFSAVTAGVFAGVLLGCTLQTMVTPTVNFNIQSVQATEAALVPSTLHAEVTGHHHFKSPSMQEMSQHRQNVGALHTNQMEQTSPSWVSSASLLMISFVPLVAGVLLWIRHRAMQQTSAHWQVLSTVGTTDEMLNVEAEVEDIDVSPVNEVLKEMEPRLCCPTCLQPLAGSICRTCSLEYEDLGSFLDLTPASGRPLKGNYDANPVQLESPLLSLPFVKESLPVIEQLEKALPSSSRIPRLSKVIKGGYLGDVPEWGKQTFENPIVAGIYERGWRQSFVRAGFPGPDEEFKKAMEWLLPAAKGRTVLDLSCGSGLFTRRFVASGEFSKVYALDYSENMLKQTRQGFDADPELSKQAATADLELVRGDVARLPFPSDSLPAIHAGAAIHCWPSPSLAMTEIARVLSPGGRAVLSTFLVPGQDVPVLNQALREVLIAPIASQVPAGMKYWEESELRDLCNRVGLVGFEVDRKQDYIMFKVEKPQV